MKRQQRLANMDLPVDDEKPREIMLWGDVLVQAIDDLDKGGFLSFNAARFMLYDGHEVRSCRWVCDVLGIDHDYLMDMIRPRIELAIKAFLRRKEAM